MRRESSIASVNGKTTDWNKLPKPPLDKKYPSRPVILVDKSIPEDDAVRQAYMPYREKTDERLNEVVGQCPVAVPGRAGKSDESAVADLAADAVRDFAKSDVALIDANAISADGLARAT